MCDEVTNLSFQLRATNPPVPPCSLVTLAPIPFSHFPFQHRFHYSFHPSLFHLKSCFTQIPVSPNLFAKIQILESSRWRIWKMPFKTSFKRLNAVFSLSETSWWNRGYCGNVQPPMFKRSSDDKHSTPPSANNQVHILQVLNGEAKIQMFKKIKYKRKYKDKYNKGGLGHRRGKATGVDPLSCQLTCARSCTKNTQTQV